MSGLLSEFQKTFKSLSGDDKFTTFDTDYGTLEIAHSSGLRLEHHFKNPEYHFAMITQGDMVLADVHL